MSGLPVPQVLGALVAGPLQFDAPVWLLLIPILGVATVLLASRSMSGLGPATRWTALGVRLVVIALLAGAMAEPQWRERAEAVSVTVVADESRSVPATQKEDVRRYVAEAAKTREGGDLLGSVTAAREAFVQQLPSRLNDRVEEQHVGATDGTNLAAGVRLALATMPKDAANRMVLASDGNETVGSILQAAEAARALGVPIDVLPIKYRYDNEVILDRLVAPANAREGETLNLRVVLQAVRAASGRLTILQNGDAIDLDPSSDALGTPVELRAGLNVLQVPIAAVASGPQRFEAVFEPLTQGGRAVGDSISENNKSLAVSFVSGEGKVLVLAETEEESRFLGEALRGAKIKAEVRPVDLAPATLTELNAYDAIVLVNQSAYGFSQKLQEELRQYVHDTGGGLVMVGGPNAFGAGGWIGSPLEDALPVKLDPPQKRQMPKGALALVIHSCEMPEGVYWGKKVCDAAVNSLSRLDLVGIVEYGWNGGTSWVHKLAPVADGTAVKRAIQNLMFGDMPDFTPSVELAYAGLKAAEAGQRHVIMISDGDPQAPPSGLLDKYVEAGITISTVGVFPHGGGDTSRMKWISTYTGGRHYEVNTQQALATIPQIFIKEAQTIRRSLIWEGEAFAPTVVSAGTESLRGVSSVPPIRGYVVTAEREGLALVTLKGKEGDPILAQWQYGLGKVVAYTSDATARWNPAWVGWDGYRAFWEQQVRWAMRPGGSANVRVVTENKGDSTVVTLEALDSKGERLNFASFKGRLALPDGDGVDVDLKQVGPGRYQGTVDTALSGSYVLSLRYAAPDEGTEGGIIEGSVQAAVSRPFADEYRTLEDNAPLLAQVAGLTGGRVLTGDPRADALWTRDGLTMPVATTAVWQWLVVLGLGLFLVDVGVRRVRVDLPGMWRATRRAFTARGEKAGLQLGGLKAARARARAGLAEREAGGTAGGGMSVAEAEAGARAAVRAAEAQARATAKRKFEAPADATKGPVREVAVGGADARPQPVREPPRPVSGEGQGRTEEGGMDRLMRAKKKARGEMGEDDDRGGT